MMQQQQSSNANYYQRQQMNMQAGAQSQALGELKAGASQAVAGLTGANTNTT